MPGAPLFLDTSALVRRYVHGPGRELVTRAMDGHDDWCASALCRSETLLALHRLAATPRQAERLWSRLRDDWDAFVVVPVDERCLALAVELGATYGLRTVDAVHLAAADRLPRPASYATFDRHQIPAAAALGFDVVAPTEP
jgi:predicted nucleic acid-binding protein